MNKIFIVLAVLVIVAGVAYFGLNNNAVAPGITVSPTPTPTPTITSSPVPSISSRPTPTVSVSPSKTPTPTHSLQSVTIVNFAYNQQIITVKKGDTVTWTNKDSAPHTVTGDGGLSSPMLSLNATYSFTFNNVGTFNYHCTVHPTMTGTVIVTQ